MYQSYICLRCTVYNIRINECLEEFIEKNSNHLLIQEVSSAKTVSCFCRPMESISHSRLANCDQSLVVLLIYLHNKGLPTLSLKRDISILHPVMLEM